MFDNTNAIARISIDAGLCDFGECDELGGGLCINKLFPADALSLLLDTLLEGAEQVTKDRFAPKFAPYMQAIFGCKQSLCQ